MRTSLKAWLISFVGILVFLVVTAVAVSVVADVSGWSAIRLGAGPLVVLETARSASESTFTLGPGLVLVAAALAAVNVGLAALLARLPRVGSAQG